MALANVGVGGLPLGVPVREARRRFGAAAGAPGPDGRAFRKPEGW